MTIKIKGRNRSRGAALTTSGVCNHTATESGISVFVVMPSRLGRLRKPMSKRGQR
jgi:hypothetical protein